MKTQYAVKGQHDRRTLRRLRKQLSGIVSKYASHSGKNVKGWAISWTYSGDGNEYYEPFVVSEKFLFFRRPVIEISPPYRPLDIKLKSRRYAPLAQELIREIALYNLAGEPYSYDPRREEQKNFMFSVTKAWKLAELTNDGEREPTQDEIESVVAELHKKKIVELRENWQN